MRQPLLLIEEVAQQLRLRDDEVCGLVHRGELRGVLIPPNHVRVDPNDLRRFLRARAVPLTITETEEAGQ